MDVQRGALRAASPALLGAPVTARGFRGYLSPLAASLFPLIVKNVSPRDGGRCPGAGALELNPCTGAGMSGFLRAICRSLGSSYSSRFKF